MKDQRFSIERLPNTVGGAKLDPAAPDAQIGAGGKGAGGIGSMLGGTTRRKKVPATISNLQSAPVPTGIEALIRPPRTDPGGQEDMRKLMDMQRQTFRSFLAPPPPDVVIQPGPYFPFPVDGS